jgi:uncharacterized protein (DUF433 family)
MPESWIVSDPEILGGKPCVRETRLSVELLLELLSQGATQQQILETYPHLPAAGLQAALEYAARALRNEIVAGVKMPA